MFEDTKDNTQNIEQTKEQTKERTEEQTEEQKLKEELDKINFPSVAAPLAKYQNETRTFYIAIPVDAMSPIVAGFFLDSLKMVYMRAFEAAQVIRKKLLIKGGYNGKEKKHFSA